MCRKKYHSFLLNKVTVLSPNIPSRPEVQTVVWLFSPSPSVPEHDQWHFSVILYGGHRVLDVRDWFVCSGPLLFRE